MGSISDTERSDSLLFARVEDMLEAKKRGQKRFVGFLDLRERAVIERRFRSEKLFFDGGYPDAERTVVTAVSDDAPPFACVGFSYREQAPIGHRDVLGSVLSLGIRREAVGDILCRPGFAAAFMLEKPAALAADSLRKIASEGVRVTLPYTGELPAPHQLQPLSGTVASPRLDAVVSVLCRIPREQAAVLIRQGLVMIRHIPCENVSAPVREGDVISVRGSGRFLIGQLHRQTKKGRLALVAAKYI